jgi:hypothetical protein
MVMETKAQRWRVIIIRNPYDCLDDDFTQNIFIKTINMKLHGFRRHFNYGVLPISNFDFFADHVIICDYQNDTPTPIMAFRSLPLKRCSQFASKNPLIMELEKFDGTEQHIESINQLIAHYNQQGVDVSYDGSVTRFPDITMPAADKKLLHELFKYLVYQNQVQQRQVVLTGAILKAKMDVILKDIHFQALKDNLGNELPIVSNNHLDNEEGMVMVQEHYQGLKELDQRYHFLKRYWDHRIEISQETITEQAQKAA